MYQGQNCHPAFPTLILRKMGGAADDSWGIRITESIPVSDTLPRSISFESRPGNSSLGNICLCHRWPLSDLVR